MTIDRKKKRFLLIVEHLHMNFTRNIFKIIVAYNTYISYFILYIQKVIINGWTGWTSGIAS